ncbi:MAG TPA: M14 family zinc carboxypeptidase [Blastocatellia bacterium]|nr:M14 family zinc carboxypeptidase [Blastocatellia bacterium]
MNRSISRRTKEVFTHFALFALLLTLATARGADSNSALAQGAQGAKTSAPAPAPAPSQPVDKEYSESIVKNTTDKMFLTEFVDHLPASDKVPTPAKILGYPVGAPNKLTYTKDQYRYYRELEKATPRVKVFSAPEKSELGREQLLVVVGDEASVANLAKYKDITAKLGDPRRINDEEAKRLIGEGKALYWASGSIHSPETGSPEMLMEMAYRLAVEETPFIQEIRKNVIVMITPTLEVDGRDMMVDLYNWRKANEGKRAPSLLYWGKYVAHDNNRDSMGMALALTRNQMATFLEYHPTILHDLHESVPFLYTSTGTGPYNAWLDPIVIDEWHALAYHEIEEMTKRGVPGVWTHGFYDGWAPNYMFYVANGHNSIGRFYETFGNGGADTQDRVVGQQSGRDWFRPNPPLPRVKWSIRNNINMQQSAILLAMNYVSNNKDRFLNNFYLKGKRSVAKARAEGPAAWVLPADDARPNEAADLVNLLKMQGCEVHRAEKDFETKDGKFPAGSYVVRMDQPYSRMADMLLDTQYYNVNDPRPYDDTGWTLGPLRNVKTVRVKDDKVLDAPMTLINGPVKVLGKVTGTGKAGYVINHNAESALAQLRFRLKDVNISAAEDGFTIGERSFNVGSFVIKSEGNPVDLDARLKKEATDLGVTAIAVNELPKVAQHPLAVPRIALVHTWVNTQDEGWYRIEFDRLGIPYDYISDHVIRNTANLREKWDVIIWGPARGAAQSIIRGVPNRGEKDPPIPWKKSDITPNMGQSPDTTDDMRGGMGVVGVANLQRFIESGGLFVTIGSNASLAIDFGITEGVSIQEARQLQARGSVINASFADRKSPIAYGYDEKLAVYFNQAPIFQTGGLGGGFGGRGGGGGAFGQQQQGRPSGRGGLGDPDIVQGRAPLPPSPPSPPGEDGIPEEFRAQAAGQMPPPEMRPRVVLRFASDEKNLLVSGMLAGGGELTGKPAVIDVPVGKGHVVMFANNPMWRHQTHGSFSMLFNAALNFNHLSVGRTAPRRANAPQAEQNGEDNDQ